MKPLFIKATNIGVQLRVVAAGFKCNGYNFNVLVK